MALLVSLWGEKMAENNVLQIDIDSEMETAAENLYRGMGITLTEAIKIFIKKSVELGKMPFEMQTEKKSAFGILAKYANPELMEYEKFAWESAVKQKHEKISD